MRIPVGIEDFDKIRRNHSYYVDKTELLYELLEGTDNAVTLFTRPRRFGKTLTLSMMENFLSIQKGDSREIFEGLAIMKHEAFCAEWMNQYPVLFVTLKGIEALSFEEAYNTLKVKISDLCKTHEKLLDHMQVDDEDRQIFLELRAQKASLANVKNSLRTLMRMMVAVYEKPVILLIDEYDVPLAKASELDTMQNRYYANMLDVIRGMFDAALKGNEYLKLAVVTGCLRIAKESIFTGTNHFASYSVLDKRFSKYFGFTQEEVDQLLETAGLKDKADVIRSWYNGYIFGKTSVYCPWDVMNYVSALQYDQDEEPKNYWKNTSHNGILLTFVNRTDFKVNGKFETLMNDGVIRQRISDELTYNTLHESEENLWSVLLMTGYLTKADPGTVESMTALKIPNKEIFSIFQDTVVKYFESHLDKSAQLLMMDAFWNGDEQTAGEMLTKVLYKTISFHNYHEEYYKAFLAGVVKGLGYEVTCEGENGLGRTDTVVKDRDYSRALILEDKKVKSEKGMLTGCNHALKQIVDGEYQKGLDDFDQVLCYGLAFYKKKVMVKLLSNG